MKKNISFNEAKIFGLPSGKMVRDQWCRHALSLTIGTTFIAIAWIAWHYAPMVHLAGVY